MTLAIMPGPSRPDVHAAFLAALPSIDKALRYHFRGLPSRRRAEAINDGRAAAWQAWAGLLRRGQDPAAIGPTGIAANAARYVRNGRQLGCGSRGRGVLDIFSKRAQRLVGFRIVGLDRQIESRSDARPDAWREWLAEDRNRATPAEVACFRIDLASWLERLPTRKRQMAELLVEGHSTGAVAELLGVSPSAVSQSRTWLEASWRDFQGADVVTDAAPARRPRGRPRKDAVTRRLS